MKRLVRENLARIGDKIDAERLEENRRLYQPGAWTRYVTRPVLLALLVTALMTGFIALIEQVSGEQRWWLLLPVLFLVALEAIYTTLWLRHPDRLSLDRTAYRAAELLLLLVLIRLAAWLLFGEGLPDLDQLRLFLTNPLALFLNGFFVAALLLALIAWRLAVAGAGIFGALAVSEFELRYYSLPLAVRKARADDQPIEISRHWLVQQFARYWLWGGVLLALSVGLSTLEMDALATLQNPLALGRLGLQPALLFALLLYFIAGFWLLSQARLMEMNARWLINGIQKDTQVERRWQRSSLLMLLLVALVAAFVPIGSSIPLGQIVSSILFVLMIIANFLIFMALLPLALLAALITGQPPEDVAQPPPLLPEDLAQQSQEMAEPLGETARMILSSGFWALFLVVVVIAALYFVRERGVRVNRETARGGWKKLLAWLRSLWFALRHRARDLQLQIRLRRPQISPLPQLKPETQRVFRLPRLGALAPREQVRYYYLATARRAAAHGVARPPGTTPLEYGEALKEKWPDADDEVEALTGAFLKARYSGHNVSAEDARHTKSIWERIRQHLRRPPVETPPAEQPD